MHCEELIGTNINKSENIIDFAQDTNHSTFFPQLFELSVFPRSIRLILASPTMDSPPVLPRLSSYSCPVMQS